MNPRIKSAFYVLLFPLLMAFGQSSYAWTNANHVACDQEQIMQDGGGGGQCVHYCGNDIPDFKNMQIMIPDGASAADPRPTIVVHMGRSGNNNPWYTVPASGSSSITDEALNRGYVVAIAQWRRLDPGAHDLFTSADSSACAVRYLREYSSMNMEGGYPIDVDRIGIWGLSGGGYAATGAAIVSREIEAGQEKSEYEKWVERTAIALDAAEAANPFANNITGAELLAAELDNTDNMNHEWPAQSGDVKAAVLAATSAADLTMGSTGCGAISSLAQVQLEGLDLNTRRILPNEDSEPTHCLIELPDPNCADADVPGINALPTFPDPMYFVDYSGPSLVTDSLSGACYMEDHIVSLTAAVSPIDIAGSSSYKPPILIIHDETDSTIPVDPQVMFARFIKAVRGDDRVIKTMLDVSSHEAVASTAANVQRTMDFYRIIFENSLVDDNGHPLIIDDAATFERAYINITENFSGYDDLTSFQHFCDTRDENLSNSYCDTDGTNDPDASAEVIWTDMSVAITDLNSPVGTYIVRVNNLGTIAAEDVNLENSMPADVLVNNILITTTGSTLSCDVDQATQVLNQGDCVLDTISCDFSNLRLFCTMGSVGAGEEVQFKVSGTNAGAESDATTRANITTSTWDTDPNNNSINEGCFIATLAFGSFSHDYVNILREFRDTRLIHNGPGAWFVNKYYKYSPSMVNWIEKHDNLKAPVRLALYPVVGVAWTSLQHPSLPFLALAVLLVIAGFLRRQIRQVR